MLRARTKDRRRGSRPSNGLASRRPRLRQACPDQSLTGPEETSDTCQRLLSPDTLRRHGGTGNRRRCLRRLRGASRPPLRRGRALGARPRASSPRFFRGEPPGGQGRAGRREFSRRRTGCYASRRAGVRGRPRPDPRQQGGGRLDRLRVLSRLRDGRDPVQRRHARRDRQRNLAGPAAARGRRHAQGAPAARPLLPRVALLPDPHREHEAGLRSPARPSRPPPPRSTSRSRPSRGFSHAYCLRVARLLGLEVSGEDYQWKGEPPRRGARTARPRRRR